MESVRKEFGALFSETTTLLGEEIVFTDKALEELVGLKGEIVGVEVGEDKFIVACKEGPHAGRIFTGGLNSWKTIRLTKFTEGTDDE